MHWSKHREYNYEVKDNRPNIQDNQHYKASSPKFKRVQQIYNIEWSIKGNAVIQTCIS